FGRGRAHPALRRLSFASGYLLRDVIDQPLLVELPQVVLPFGIGAAVADHLVAARSDLVGDLRMILVEERVDVVRGGKFQLLEQLEQPPDADAVAVVAPRVIPLLLRLAFLRGVPAGAFAIGVDLYVGRGAEGKPLAVRPRIVLALVDRRI